MASTDLSFATAAAHHTWLQTQAQLPRGFRVGTHRFSFTPVEVGGSAEMTLTLIAAAAPCSSFAALFTRNALPGAPVLIGRERLEEPALQAIAINNKISNVCAPDGVATSEAICAAVGAALDCPATAVLPSSTGVIGWQLPRQALVDAVPAAAAALQGESILPAAEGIVTTDLYAKVRSATVGAGRIVGIAKGAGMVEPNLATMLVYVLTDLDVPRDHLRHSLTTAVGDSFNRISIDSDQSTSDTVAALSSGLVACDDLAAFDQALAQVCADLAEDVVRNGEGVHHVQRVSVSAAPNAEVAVGLARAVVNSPLWQCALAGNDPNVGRLVCAIGNYLGNHHPDLDLSQLSFAIADEPVFADGTFALDPDRETRLVAALQAAELYASQATADGQFHPPVRYPVHERCVPIHIDLGLGAASASVIGGDRTHEYITENADYRS